MATPLRVLMVEDMDDDVLLIVRILKKSGYDPDYLHVETVADMRSALREKSWDVILCDYKMSGFNGLQAIALLKETELDIPLIIVSGTIGEEAAVECMRLGARDYIRKENLPLLIPAIERELAEAQIRNSLKEVESQWRKSWENYRMITETAHDYIIILDLNNHIIFANKAARDLAVGIELIGLDIAAIIIPERHAEQQERMRKRREGWDEISSFEWEFLDATGKTLIMDVRSQLMKEKNAPTGVLFIARNITEQKRANEMIRQSEERYRSIIEQMEEGYFETDLAGNFVFFNDGECRNLGYSREELTGMNNRQFMDEKNAAAVYRAFNKIYRTGMALKDYALEIIKKDGTKAYDEISVSLIRSAQSQPVGFRGTARDVTERKRVEEALRESEDKYRLVVENAREAIMIIQNAKLVFVNRMTIEMTQYPESLLVGYSIHDFVHPDDLDLVIDNHFRRLQGEILPFIYSFRIVTRTGQTRWVELKAALITWKGQPATLNFLTDITDRMASEEAIKQLVERLDLATHAANLGVWDRDLLNDRMIWNDRMYELYGVDKEQFRATHDAWVRCLHPDDAIPTLLEMEKALKGEKDYQTEFRVIHPDGALKYIRTYGMVTRDASGKPLRITGINLDITERKQAENKLRENEFRYRSLFTEISEGFALHEIICDDNGKPVDYRFLDVNPAFEKLTGLKADDVIGRCGSQISLRSESFWIEMYGNVAQTGEPVSFDDYAKDLDCYYHVNAFCPQKGQFATLFSDITERKNMEAQLIQAQKMEAIGTLAGGIAHDFNNILGAIIGYAGMAQEELPPDSPTLECIDEIFRASERAKKLVEQILAFSRRHDAERKPLLIVPLIKEIVKLLRPMLPSTIRIKQNIHIRDAFVLADATQVHQVLMNLCTNAAHAMQEKGGTLAIGLKQMTVKDDHHVLSGHLKAGDYLELQVADDGHGINEKIQDLIFDPFFTTKRTGEGTGMGLSVVHGIVKSYGGHIRLESKVGEGTTFYIYLPLLQEQTVQDSTEHAAPAAGGTERILLIDDQDFMLEMMSKALSRLGYKVTAQENSRDALQLFMSDPAAFDLVITDQTMPYLTGADMARDILRTRPEIPIILCTGYSSTISPEQAKFIGIREYVMKPVVIGEFTRLIRKVLEENRRQEEPINHPHEE